MPSPFSARSFAARAADRAARETGKADAEPPRTQGKAEAPREAPISFPPRAPLPPLSGTGAAKDPDPAPAPGLAEAPAPYAAPAEQAPEKAPEQPPEQPRARAVPKQPARRTAASPEKPAARLPRSRPAAATAAVPPGLPEASAAPRGALLTPQPPAGTLRLVPLQALAKGGRWRTEAMRSYQMPLLLWFTRGQGRITLAGLTRGYGAHNAIFVPPRCMHGFEVTAQVYGTAIFFNADHGLPLPDAPVHLRVRDAVAQGEVTTILEQLGREIDGDRPLRSRAIHHQAGLLSVWLDRQIANAGDEIPNTAALRLMRRFTEQVEAQLYTGQGVSDYAEALGVTPTHLSRVCREMAGRSASDILADRMTFEARRLLAETSLPIKQVAQILGFGSAAYFTRAFQNRTGQTPSQFRAAA